MNDVILKMPNGEAWRWSLLEGENGPWHSVGFEPWPANVEAVVVGYDRKGREMIGAFTPARAPAPAE